MGLYLDASEYVLFFQGGNEVPLSDWVFYFGCLFANFLERVYPDFDFIFGVDNIDFIVNEWVERLPAIDEAELVKG